MGPKEYGLVANYKGGTLKAESAKCWLVGLSGFDRYECLIKSRKGQHTKKWFALHHLENFRCAWIARPLRDEIHLLLEKSVAIETAKKLQDLAQKRRVLLQGQSTEVS